MKFGDGVIQREWGFGEEAWAAFVRVPVSRGFQFIRVSQRPFPVAFHSLRAITRDFVGPFSVFSYQRDVKEAPFCVHCILQSRRDSDMNPFPIAADASHLLMVDLRQIEGLHISRRARIPFVGPRSRHIDNGRRAHGSFCPVNLPLYLRGQIRTDVRVFDEGTHHPWFSNVFFRSFTNATMSRHKTKCNEWSVAGFLWFVIYLAGCGQGVLPLRENLRCPVSFTGVRLLTSVNGRDYHN